MWGHDASSKKCVRLLLIHDVTLLYLALTVACLYVGCPLPDPVRHPEEGVISRTVVAGAHLL